MTSEFRSLDGDIVAVDASEVDALQRIRDGSRVFTRIHYKDRSTKDIDARIDDVAKILFMKKSMN